MNEPRTLGEILAILRRHKNVLHAKFGVLDLAVFGSYVNNQATEASDVDLLVGLKPECKTFDNYMELKFFLEEQLHKKIDLGIKESTRDEVKADIIRQAVYV
jgi:predicted nucleotidyltransferase